MSCGKPTAGSLTKSGCCKWKPIHYSPRRLQTNPVFHNVSKSPQSDITPLVEDVQEACRFVAVSTANVTKFMPFLAS